MLASRHFTHLSQNLTHPLLAMLALPAAADPSATTPVQRGTDASLTLPLTKYSVARGSLCGAGDFTFQVSVAAPTSRVVRP
jgi:hypothetical protein